MTSQISVDRDERKIVLHLRPGHDSTQRFTALNQQIERLNHQLHQREDLERERRALVAKLEEASQFKDELLAAVSHELRTPIHAISGWLSLLRSAGYEPSLLEQGLEVIERNMEVQTQLVNDLTDTSLLITGRMRLRLSRVDLDKIVREAVNTVRPSAEAKNQRIEVIAEADSCVVEGDPNRLLQIVWNLLSNATKYTPKGGKIQVLLRRVNSHAEIEIRDNGVGIDPEVLPFVFDRFRRADNSTTRRAGGLGLGLAIVRHLVELHGGVVSVHSSVDLGSTFIVSLPLPLASSPKRALESGRRPGRVSNELEGLNLLLVEDHTDSRELLAAVLRSRGAYVVAVESGARALEELAREPPSVIISDIEMPEMDGLTLMRRIRALEGDGASPTAAIAVSAHSTQSIRLRALQAGYQVFLAKPIKPDELIAMITSLAHLRGG